MILGLGAPELIIILLVVLVIFGPKNLPKLGKSLGKTVKNVREGMEGTDDEDSSKKVEKPAEDTNVEDVVATDSDEDADASDAEAEDGVFCTKCGTKNPAGSAFCSKCGAKLAE